MSIIWEVASSLLSALPGTKIMEEPLASDYRVDPADEERLKNIIERNRRFSDPIYKKNLQSLIERNRQFEKKE